jgi:magnesium-transporting ATPase (P-type)
MLPFTSHRKMMSAIIEIQGNTQYTQKVRLMC